GVVDPDGRVGLERQGDMAFPRLREVKADIREVRIVFLSPPPGMGLRDFPPRDIRASIQGDTVFSAAALVSQSRTPGRAQTDSADTPSPRGSRESIASSKPCPRSLSGAKPA